jgi:hypothetical protein
MTVTNRKWIQTKKTQLYTSIGTSTNSILLKNCFKLNGAELDMEDDFGTLGYMTLEPGGLKEEIISFTGLSYNVSGTICTITGVTRGLSGNSAYGSGGTAYGHSANRVAIFTNNPQHYNGFANKYNDETIERIWTFTTATRPKLTTDADAVLSEELVTLGQVNRLIQATYLPPQIVATSSGTTGTSQTATLTYALTIPTSATDRVLYVEINSEENKTISTVTWGGVALTQVATKTRTTGNIRVEIWRLIAPATGTANIVITPSANAYITSHATAFSSVNQTTPEDAISTGSDGSGTAVSDSVTTITQGAIILASVGTALDPTTFTPTAPLLEQLVNSSGTNRPLSTSVRSTTTAGVYSPAYTITSTNYCIKAVAIRGIAVSGIAGVSSVTGLNTDNTDPANPIVQISVDGSTITGDGTPGNPLVSVGGGGGGGGGTKIAVDTTQSVVTASSTTDIYTIPIPGGTLGTNNAIRLKVLLSHLRDDVSVAVALKYGGTTIATGALNGSGFNGNGWIEGTIVANNASNAQKGDIAILGSNNPVTIDSLVSEYGTSAVDSSISQNLVLTVTTGGGNSALTSESIIVESIGGTGSGSSGTLLSIKNGTTTYDTSTASGTQTIAHGLGEVPISVSLKATLAYNPTTNLASIAQANTTYNGTTQSSNSTFHQSVNGAGQQSIDGSTFVIYQDNVPTNYVTGTVTFDANNIYIAWVKTGTNTGTAEILWQAEAGGGGNGNKFIGVGETTNINWFNGELSFVQLDGGADAWTIANPSGVLTESKTDLTTNTTCSIEDWCVDWATGGVLNFNSGKQVIVQGIVVYDAVDDKCGWGFGDAIWNCQGAANNNFGFVTDAAGAFYTYTGAVGGVTYTETPITSLSSGTHVLRIEVDPANATPQIRFYVDGALVSTHTTNVATTEPLDFSLGNSGGAMNGILAVSSPTFAVEI